MSRYWVAWGMRRSRPLPDTNPELLVIETPGLCREYRVENWHLARDGSGRIIKGVSRLAWKDVIFAALATLMWSSICTHTASLVAFTAILVLIIYQKCTQVLWESVLVIPPHGIQLETHRGFPSYPLFASRTFIPLTTFQNFIINEGLRRWDVRFYLAVLQKPSNTALHLEVAYENLLPHFPVLIEVYRGVHKFLQTGSETEGHEK